MTNALARLKVGIMTLTLGMYFPPRRLSKYWSGPRVEAEGVDAEERARRIPTVDCNE